MSLATLAAEIDSLELSLDRAELRQAFALRDRLDARLAIAAAEYEAAGLHELDGSVTLPSWLRSECGRDPSAAQRIATAGRKLRGLPVVAAAARDGSLSGGQVEVVLANVAKRHVERFAQHEAELVPHLVGMSVDDTVRVMQEWRRRADALDDGGPPVEHDNQLHWSRTINSRGELRASFDADTSAVTESALGLADPRDFSLTLAERRAVAWAQICQHFLDHQHVRRGGRHRPHVNVRIDIHDLETAVGGTYVDTGQPVAPAALGVLKCDSVYHRLLFSGSSGVLDYGRATRAWPVDVYNAIVLRDGGCRIGECSAPPSWCDVHHVRHWEDGGTTSVDNGILGCRRHHRMAHLPGHHLKLLPDGTVEFTLPDGRVLTSRPRGPDPPLAL